MFSLDFTLFSCFLFSDHELPKITVFFSLQSIRCFCFCIPRYKSWPCKSSDRLSSAGNTSYCLSVEICSCKHYNFSDFTWLSYGERIRYEVWSWYTLQFGLGRKQMRKGNTQLLKFPYIMATITTNSFFSIAFSATSQTFDVYQSNLCQLEQKTSVPSYLRSMLLQSF